ncbi:MAG: molybdopterin molybdotransferase MoeA [Chitinophagaceae bacterium]
MVTVAEADKIILAESRHYGMEGIPFDSALGRVLATGIVADRDQPPGNRVTMDGIAINFDAFANGVREFRIRATQAAGDSPINIGAPEECIEIMTGAVLPATTDTIIRYEDLDIKDQKATLLVESITRGQNIHLQGKDKKKEDRVAAPHQRITPAIVHMAASVGLTTLSVMKLPRTVIISSGDELVEVDKTPSDFQVRMSNNHSIKAVLKHYGLQAAMLYIPDNPGAIDRKLEKCLQEFEVILLSGGVSMGKFDYIPQALEKLSVKKHFHKVKQKPGKPFWFGKHSNGVVVFAFPGNPVSTFMCLHRYFLPWLEASLQLDNRLPLYAILNEDFTFNAPLQYFLQVKIQADEKGMLLATPLEGNGSGDYANLLDTNAFMELPAEVNVFRKGDVYRVWRFGEW